MDYQKTEKLLGTVGCEELAEEILAAVKDLFVGSFERMGNRIRMALPSGEKFLLTVETCE